MIRNLATKLRRHRDHSDDSDPRPPIPGNHPVRGNQVQTARLSSHTPFTADIYRHRKQVGVNLGAWFVGEKWISDELFSCCKEKSPSELSSVEGHIKKHGIAATRAAWEQHWATWVTETDLDFLVEHGINAVRIPIGWFSLSDASLTKDTDFEHVSDVYTNCWEGFIRPFIDRCAERSIGVLLDLHCLPGGQNTDSHSGTHYGRSDLYTKKTARSKALSAIQIMIDRVSSLDNVIGVQAMNEPAWGKEQFLEPFYSECLSYSHCKGGVPLYIGDCWNLDHWSRWVGSREEFCVVDHHYYYCFTSENHAQDPQTIIEGIKESSEMSTCSTSARGNIVIGEWSLAMDQKSKARGHLHPDAAQKTFGHTQLEKYTSHFGGCFFWTYKFQVRNNTNEWDLRDMIMCGSLPSPLQASHEAPANIAQQFTDISAEKLDIHSRYWDSQGGEYEHWRFEAGFLLGWTDAQSFAATCSTIGFLGEWTKKRTRMHVQEHGSSKMLWEFEHGFQAGVKAFESVCGPP